MYLKRKKSLIIISLVALMLLTTSLPIYGRGIVSTELTGLNVRSEPSLISEIITSIAKGKFVELISYDDGWWYVEYEKGKYGYCADTYITELNSTLKFEYDGYYAPVELDVVSYKQYDSKWGKLTIGNSGQNIYTIGCALTCVAMVESYRTDEDITPKDIVNTFSFTNGGALYWTDDYNLNWTENYLEIIYCELLQGKPVILEGKTLNNITHWIVITGFIGGDELTADKFIINDPGSSKRTLLSDFFDTYPIYSKIVQVSTQEY